jgi:hypothetical protein
MSEKGSREIPLNRKKKNKGLDERGEEKSRVRRRSKKGED